MTGAIMQLVCNGAQDMYLTGNPKITHFKMIYRRHTNFSMESVAQSFLGTVGFGNRVSALISRNGDLIRGMVLEITFPEADGNGYWSKNPGHAILQEVEVEIGGQLIDRHYSDWLEIWSQLTIPADKRLGYNKMVGQNFSDNNGGFLPPQLGTAGGPLNPPHPSYKVSIPLQFWFCRNAGLALPLIALQYHEVKINIKFRSLGFPLTQAFGVNPTEDIKAELWVDYIYLDVDERRRFAQVSHEYLIEQLQISQEACPTVGNKSLALNFNHPVKELIWVYTEDINRLGLFYTRNVELGGSDNFSNYDSVGKNPFLTAKLLLNGHDRFAERDGKYFNLVQPYNHHTCIPGSPGINIYSFALNPEAHHPSGTCNFSRIDSTRLNVTLGFANNQDFADTTGLIKVFATNYNVLRIMSGMGGLAYSN